MPSVKLVLLSQQLEETIVSIPPESLQLILGTLCKLLLESADPQIRAKAAESLGLLGLEEGIPTLREAIFQDDDLQVRLNAIDALVLIAKPQPIPMSESKNQPSFNIQQVGNINTGDVTIQGDQVGIQHNYAQEQSLTEAAAEIQQLLTQLAQTYPNEADRQVEVVKREAKRNPTFKNRLVSAAKAGGVEAVKQLLDYVFKNPVASVVAESVKAFVEAE